MARIDAHLHVFARASQQFPRESTELAPAEREETVEKFLDVMETHAIDQAMLVQIGGAQIDQHAYLQHCLTTYPERFLGIGLIPADCPEPEQHMDQLAADGGIVGFRLGALGGPRDPFAAVDVRELSTYRIWQHAAAKDYVLWLYLRAADAHLTAYLVEAFPQVRVVFNHLGICPGEGKFSVDEHGRPRVDTPSYNPSQHTVYRLARYENVTVLLSGQYAFSKEAYPYKDLLGWHRTLFNDFGPKRLMWATDAPWIYRQPGYAALTKVLDELLPDMTEADRADIMGGTARRFLRFPERKTGV
jgi:L-fuconolactonase